jgi:hypothetical protein
MVEDTAPGVVTARLLCFGSGLAAAAAAVALSAAQQSVADQPAAVYMDSRVQAAVAALAIGELTGWYFPLRLVGMSDFRSSVLFSLLFNGAMRKVMWRLAYFVMSFLYRNEEWTCMNCARYHFNLFARHNPASLLFSSCPRPYASHAPR